jgi:hypothetical protein
VLAAARAACPTGPLVARRWTTWPGWPAPAARHPELQVGFDLSDLSGYAYYSGPRFALYGADWSDALARGGRYDEVGAVFGRNRPAVGFSLDLKALAEVAGCRPAEPGHPGALGRGRRTARGRAAPARRRRGGRLRLPGHAEGQEFVACDRELVSVHGRWLRPPCWPAEPKTRIEHANRSPGGSGRNVVVVGTQWGDEGKGKVVDWLTDHAQGVVRFQGGHNAGHTLVIAGARRRCS